MRRSRCHWLAWLVPAGSRRRRSVPNVRATSSLQGRMITPPSQFSKASRLRRPHCRSSAHWVSSPSVTNVTHGCLPTRRVKTDDGSRCLRLSEETSVSRITRPWTIKPGLHDASRRRERERRSTPRRCRRRRPERDHRQTRSGVCPSAVPARRSTQRRDPAAPPCSQLCSWSLPPPVPASSSITFPGHR
jgi:hypothetical protein